jgi:hypothetical protein
MLGLRGSSWQRICACAVLCCAVLRCDVLCCAVLCCDVMCCGLCMALLRLRSAHACLLTPAVLLHLLCFV